MASVEQRCLIHTDLDTAFDTSQDYACRSQREADDNVTVTAWHGMKLRVGMFTRTCRHPDVAGLTYVEALCGDLDFFSPFSGPRRVTVSLSL